MATTTSRLPVLEGVLPVDRKRIPTDIAAGVTLAALAIPEVMGYTKIAGMPVVTGLYTILLPIARVRAARVVPPPRGRAPTRRPRRSWPPAWPARRDRVDRSTSRSPGCWPS